MWLKELIEKLTAVYECNICKPECTRCCSLCESGWCKVCSPQALVEMFGTWTSGNGEVDSFIQKTQAEAQCKGGYLLWIDPQNITDTKHIGDGGFGSVYQARWKETPLKHGSVALKIVNANERTASTVLDEIKIMVRVRNRHSLPKVYGITRHQESNKYAIVMEYFKEKSLQRFKHQGLLTWKIRCYHLQWIAHGLLSVHEAGVLHGDLHSGNVLNNSWSEESPVVISDFGLSRYLDGGMHNSEGSYGIIPYMAPELLRGRPHSKASDIYAFGMLMWELSSGVPPFCDQSHDVKLMFSICDGMRPSILEGTPDIWVDLMKRCWDVDPAKRPTAREVFDEIYRWKESNEIAAIDLLVGGAGLNHHRHHAQPTYHRCSYRTSRFIPSIPTFEAYADRMGIATDKIDDDTWQAILYDMCVV